MPFAINVTTQSMCVSKSNALNEFLNLAKDALVDLLLVLSFLKFGTFKLSTSMLLSMAVADSEHLQVRAGTQSHLIKIRPFWSIDLAVF